MPNFLEKLKKGMGIEEAEKEAEKEAKKEEIEETKEVEKTEEAEEKVKKEKKGAKKISLTKEEEKTEKEEVSELSAEPEGELLIDLFEDEDFLYLISPIAGVKGEELDIEIEEEMLKIEGERKNPSPEGIKYLTKECYWGRFSRKILLPSEVDPNRVEAEFKNGILFLKFPKISREKKKKIKIKEEN